MLTHQVKVYSSIAAIFVAVILLSFGIYNLVKLNNSTTPTETIPEDEVAEDYDRHPLHGGPLEDDFFPVAIMFDNAYDVRPQYGLSKAVIVYEALAEGTITRLMGIFDSTQFLDKIGPVRSARPYFMDWAEEYSGIYMHVGGSPTALSTIHTYDFYNIDQIGANEIYFWRDNNLNAPHNVFTSSANWLRVGELKEIKHTNKKQMWNFVDDTSEGFPLEGSFMPPLSFIVDFSIESYKVEWKFNSSLNMYQRWQGDEKHSYGTGEQIAVKNVIIQVAPSRIIDAKERRSMDNKTSNMAYLYNSAGLQTGEWKYENGQTVFYLDSGELMQLVPGRTWIEVVPSEDSLKYQ